ncbi:D-glycero-beta-D-manno-heptose 1-phosphate adenylyltransferase [Rhizobium sp. PL01]|uniref:D-glycero-beta-D-manno-heptose 1-phosphate adenylyltransferase n=1 Tax=Rhizobium sp. PL01 TaxID=3085631 RepID=UPI002980F5D7|nr:D-glycero-beta-D-manno-heptose 1-phosphate adenylyltransferase [Rhizobium sp. PL01]MDW5315997.1 D-glycero-beta-D-manno-heptose 1-phosphate adenylyltransferase [Rhizobium sp. PL01]
MNLSSITNWKDKTVFVLGDVMLDKFVYGNVERVSPEAPIPVLHFRNEEPMLGGSANVARNVVALGGKAILSGVIGDDETGRLIRNELVGREGIHEQLVQTSRIPTTVKTRFVSGGQQIMRLDVEAPLSMDDGLERELRARFLAVSSGLDAVVLSDYAKGVLSETLVREIIRLARGLGLPVIVDPKTSAVGRFAGATVITPNALEAEMITGFKCNSNEAAERAVRIIIERSDVASVIITRGQDGMTVLASNEVVAAARHISANAHEVYDVSGAGDTVVAAIALAVASNCGLEEAAEIANVAAGISVSKRGTSVVFPHEIRRSMNLKDHASDDKIVECTDAIQVVANWKREGLKVGFTNGCYDLIHPGHVQLLKKAKAACDRLVVALNTDASVRRLKGDTRPIQNEIARATVMASLAAVDLVTFFAEDTPLSLVQQLVPDVLIKGADYNIETVVGSEFVVSHGGKIVLVPLEEGHSTTSIVSRSNARGIS